MKKLSIAFMYIFFSSVCFAQDIFLNCKSDDSLGFESTVSLITKNGNRILQMDSVIMENNKEDSYGGVAKISETPAQIKIEYRRPNGSFFETITIDRIKSMMIIISNPTGVDQIFTERSQCQTAKPKF